jgi:uncharacterized protein (UPF0254 family)
MIERKHKTMEKLYIARFRVKQYKGLDMPLTNWDVVALKDISTGGMVFNYNNNLGIDTHLDLKINISKSVPTINCVGKITRIQQSQPDSMFRTATEFTEISEKEKEMINKMTEGILE